MRSCEFYVNVQARWNRVIHIYQLFTNKGLNVTVYVAMDATLRASLRINKTRI